MLGLFPQPGGFEGFGSVVERPKTNELAVTEVQEVDERSLQLEALTCLCTEADEGHDEITRCPRPFDLDMELGPRLDQQAPELTNAVVSVIGPLGHEAGRPDHCPLDLGIGKRERGVEVPSVPGVVATPHPLVDLLRYRLRQPGGFEGLAPGPEDL
jgi:hypothetical protein